MNQRSLEKLVGNHVIVRSPVLDEKTPVLVKLLGVETGGIWIESQNATEHWLAELKVRSTPKTPVFFVPYTQVAWILDFADYPGLSEKSFGLGLP